MHTDKGHQTRKNFAKSLNDAVSQGARCIILTGDISETPYLIDDLYWLSQNFARNIYFVLGNHDYYYGSFTLGNQCAEIAEQLGKKDVNGNWKPNNLFYLQNKDPINLETGDRWSGATLLIGVNGWYDLRNCDNILNHVLLYSQMTDFDVISSLKEMVDNRSSNEELIASIQSLADAETELLASKLDLCLRHNPEKIIIATHVPPLVFGKDSFTGFYSNKNLMECLLDYSVGNPEIEISVLCGHNHNGESKKLDNLTIYCKKSRYENPDLNILTI